MINQLSSKTTSNLLLRIAQGDEKAFNVFFEQHHTSVFNFCIPILQDRKLCEELVQEVMLKIWQMGEELLDIQNIDGYLRRLARNKAIDFLRMQQSRKRANDFFVAQAEISSKETEERILLREARKLLDQAIENLSSQQREVYCLFESEGLNSYQISEKLNISRSTVQTHLKVAKKNIRDYLRRHIDLAVILIIFKLF
ncbi:RNA polymerase sigma-70 factor, ECF subfamily [Sphingobacterium nematocida]|uniref:RNA polymerase sigma-70 factor, ECF subfamily n=1 Tax=Sphingobacterium nematocida TaxID=1513896 RepID=A0A1T5AUV4_9SPHI|nr:sigma-70 family RNA polymerase sigma factor [Sphingobacterium nematocida]SKB38831.1 RNA polymerase sigma-70 factor, ECF subfamily [Sphingobacterium nematocida]